MSMWLVFSLIIIKQITVFPEFLPFKCWNLFDFLMFYNLQKLKVENWLKILSYFSYLNKIVWEHIARVEHNTTAWKKC